MAPKLFFKKPYKKAVYYCFRYLGWCVMLWYFIRGPVSKLFACIETDIGESVWHYIVTIFFGTLINKIALNKVFFKEYQHIRIAPKFAQITWWLSLKVYLQQTAVALPPIFLYYLVFLDDVDIADIPSEQGEFISSAHISHHWIIIIPIILLVIFAKLVLLRKTVLRNADVVLKEGVQS
jgi:hypothetical protein